MTEIKPCPFCGEQAEIFLDDKDMIFATPCTIVRCKRCPANTRSYFRETAIEAWNRRADE